MSTKQIRAIKLRGWNISHVCVDGPSMYYVLPATARVHAALKALGFVRQIKARR